MIKEKLKEYGIEVIYTDSFESWGFYNTILNIIVINQNICSKKMENALLHEIYHAIHHRDMQIIYNKSYTARSLMETDANRNMVHEKLLLYFNQYEVDDYESFNWVEFIEWAGFKLTSTLEWLVKDEYMKLISEVA